MIVSTIYRNNPFQEKYKIRKGIIDDIIFKIIEPEAGPPFTSYNSSLHNAYV